MRTIGSLIAGSAAGIAVLAAPAAAPAETIATLAGPTHVREYAGTIVFSQLDPATRRYALVVRRAGSERTETVPVASSARPFDADIGPDAHGRPELIYQRCGEAPGAPTGCDLFVFSLDGAGGERPVSNANHPRLNDTAGTIWRGRIAWTRDYGRGSEPNPVVYTKTLSAPRSRPSTRLPGVPQRRCGDIQRVCGPTSFRSVRELELRGERLAMVVGYGCRACAGISQMELRLDDLRDRSANRIAFQVSGLSGQALVGPSLLAGRVGWYKTCHGDQSACLHGAGGPFRYTLATRRYEHAPQPAVTVDGFADAGARQYRAAHCIEPPEDPYNALCRVEAVAPPAYVAVRAPLG